MLSPRAVADIHTCLQSGSEAPPSLLAASDYKYAEELKKLKQENMQLRRDLEDANNRIRELEINQCTTSLFMPSSSYADSDDFSVEVSVTSSTTTVPMGSLSTNLNEDVQQQRDDEETSLSDIIKARGANYRLSQKSRRQRNPFSQAVPRKIPELRRLFSSESESSVSASSHAAVSSSASTRSGGNIAPRKSSEVSSYAMNYFQRAGSSDDDSDSSSNDASPRSGLRFEV